MRKVSEYQKAAEDCRKRAAIAPDGASKKALEHLAATWEMLAKTRLTQIEKGLTQPINEYGEPSNLVSFPPTDLLARPQSE